MIIGLATETMSYENERVQYLTLWETLWIIRKLCIFIGSVLIVENLPYKKYS